MKHSHGGIPPRITQKRKKIGAEKLICQARLGSFFLRTELIAENLTSPTVLSCLYSRCYSLSVLFQSAHCPLCISRKTVRDWLFVPLFIQGTELVRIRLSEERRPLMEEEQRQSSSHCIQSCQEAVKRVICVSCVLRN